MTSRTQVDALANGLSHLAALAKRDLREFFAALAEMDVDAARAALLEYLPLLVERYGDMAAAYAADWYDAQRADAPDGFRAQVYPGKPLAAVAARTDSASSHLLHDRPDLALAALLDALDRYVKQPARSTILENGLADPKRPRFARVPRGATTCDFCLMLASRGAVYLTRQSAGELNRWHGQCDCQIVPADALPEGYDPDALLEQWRATQAAKQT